MRELLRMPLIRGVARTPHQNASYILWIVHAGLVMLSLRNNMLIMALRTEYSVRGRVIGTGYNIICTHTYATLWWQTWTVTAVTSVKREMPKAGGVVCQLAW